MLSEFGRDLSELAQEGQLETLIGREAEIDEIIRILLREGKANPLLLGPPGVGKTQIVEGLAQKIVFGQVPESLKGFRVFEISINDVFSGTPYRGQAEENLKEILQEATENGNTILFIDEIHNLVSGKGPLATGDVAEYLKPFLARGDIKLIGASTEAEFKRCIEERNPAFARRFIKVQVGEMPREDLVTLLIGVGKKIGGDAGLVIIRDTVEAVIDLGKKYIPERYFPDLGIDLLKEAAALKNAPDEIAADSFPTLNQILPILETELALLRSKGATEKILGCLHDWRNKVQIFDQRSITRKDIERVIAKKTGALISTDSQDLKTKVENFEKRIRGRIVGQNRAVETILQSFKKLATGFRSGNQRPIASFLFLGPSGTGKTECARVIAQSFFGSESNMIRFNMSEFHDKHTIVWRKANAAGS